MKKYWKDIESKGKKDEVRDAPDNVNPLMELVGDQNKNLQASRRDFLKLCGFSFAVTALTACHSKISKAVPYAYAPVELTPGEASFYASSYVSGSEYCSILVKTRDGRPIKIEGNPESSISQGRTTARVQASVLDLYDGNRFHHPVKDGTPVSWLSIDEEIPGKLKKISDAKGAIVLLTPTIFSPSTEAIISDFLKKYPGAEWIQYDAISYSAMLEANKTSFGKQVIPDYHFEKADLIVSFAADFLGTWLSPVEYIRQFSSRRDPDGQMNYFIQLESTMSVTGSNADKRIQIKPSQESSILLNIYKDILKSVENRDIEVPASPFDVKEISQKLLSSSGKSIVVSGSNDKQNQLLVNEINTLLGNIGKTILLNPHLRTHAALDRDMEMLTGKMQQGKVDALLIWNVNPCYSYFNRDAFSEGLKKVGLTVSLSGSPDETANAVQYICPDNHYLESWNDAEPKKNHFSLMQPAIDHLFDTRQMTDTLLAWMGSSLRMYDFVHAFWIEKLMSHQTEIHDPAAFFDKTLERGTFEPEISEKEIPEKDLSSKFDHRSIKTDNSADKGTIEIVLYESISLGDGRQANNPWLQELPDPVSKICWDNFAAFSPAQAKELGLNDKDVVAIGNFELPVFIQAGQAYGTIGIALGYGHSDLGIVADRVGTDVWPLLTKVDGNVSRTARIDKVNKTGRVYLYAQTQTHHSMEGRNFVREAAIDEYRKNPSAGNEMHEELYKHSKSIYNVRSYPHHHWGMAIDLNKCTGCATCVIACMAENNVPVVGKEEVHRVHEMHWLRIDRYYTGDENNPEVVFQPVLCQHCELAPCENVCPVAATNHSSEGLNQMIYNRCFGTRYCNNNCPYKVRRFNWFNYTAAGTLKGNLRDKEMMTSDIRRMVLNPDVTVRAQGVIEKCSFCVQRIQAAKLKAKYENRPLGKNDVQSACSQSCPANAIVFGDLNDETSDLYKLVTSGRRYNLLEELLTLPSVSYLTKIKNKST
jgi:Fe-S-cluster-containing dehydrogenase component/anaerobic selenocysteine-containing dehydrogenase